MAVGIGATAAQLLGDTPCGGPSTGITSSGTNQATAVALTGTIGLLNPSAANATYSMWSGVPLYGEVKLHNAHATNAAVLYPPSGHALNGATNGTLSIPAGKGVYIFKQGTTDWRTILSS